MTDAGAPTPPLRVLIVDDEAPARRRLRRLVAAMSDVEVAGEADGGVSAVAAIRQLAPTLVLLDVQMPELDGFGVVEAVGAAAMPAVIFVTAHDAHAIRAFEVGAFDYLLKPVAPERLAQAVARARQRLTTPVPAAVGVAPAGASGIDAPAPAPADDRETRLGALLREREPWLRRVLVEDERGAQLLPIEAVDLVRAERNYVALHSARGRFRLRTTLAAFAERLDPAHFERVNRSDVVRLDAIRELQPWTHGEWRIVLRDGSALLWSRRWRKGRERFRV